MQIRTYFPESLTLLPTSLKRISGNSLIVTAIPGNSKPSAAEKYNISVKRLHNAYYLKA